MRKNERKGPGMTTVSILGDDDTRAAAGFESG